jgi:alpha-L-arabinofuranosidase
MESLANTARRLPRIRRLPRVSVESLESRTLLAVITVNAAQVVREVAPRLLGVNLAWWDTQLPTARTRQMVQDAGLNFFRFPGGSSSDEFHFADPPSYNGRGTAASFASFVASVGAPGGAAAQAVVTLNYGTGSPQEAAAWLAYLNATPADATPIGTGQQWNGTTGTWVQKDWKTAGYWAGLRSAFALATNDGLNFLRLGRAAPFGVHYFEVGNEIYGSWEVDRHGAGGDTGLPHDPATYAAFAKKFADYAALIDPTISIGIDSGSVGTDTGWTARVLQQGKARGFVPGFVSDHAYMQGPGGESDPFLLTQTVTGANQGTTDPHNWAARATAYRALINRNLGAAQGAAVELLATEYNSVYSNPGKQTTSLVNGLFAADSIGMLMQTEYDGANFWDLRNGWDTANNNSASLYGWRQGGDYGMLGTGSGPAPSTGTYVPYPTYFAHQLASKVILDGDAVVSARSDTATLSAYAVRQDDGGFDLLVINKNATTDLAGQFQFQGFLPDAGAKLWQYGKAEDAAQSRTTDGHAQLSAFAATLPVSGSNFSYTFPSYSMTVIELDPAPAQVAGRHTFYNDSALDRGDPGPSQWDDAAIAVDKVALLSGQTASFSNVTSYSAGINGVIVDVAGLPGTAMLAPADFVLETGAGGTWTPLAAQPLVAVRRGAGTSGTDRVTVILPDGAARNTWLRVTLKATPTTGLASPDVFSFGNLVGDAGGVGAPTVDARDVALTRRCAGSTAPAALARYDYDRDGGVDWGDVALARANQRRTLPPPQSSAPVAAAADVGSVVSPPRLALRPRERRLLDDSLSAPVL